jgi:hypothetical protein
MNPTRKEKRIPAVVPIRVFNVDQDGHPTNCLSHTLSVSRRGARLAGVTLPVKVGSVVRIQRGRANANFKVVWVGSSEDGSLFQVGVASLEIASNFWGLEESSTPPDLDERVSANRRVPTRQLAGKLSSERS